MTELLRPSLVLGGEGMIVSWRSPLGPAVARFDTWSRQEPTFARTLGNPGADLPSSPALWPLGDALVAIWCEEAGAFGARIDEKGEASEPTLLVPDAKSAVLARGAERSTLFCADERGVVYVDIDDRPNALGEPRRCVSERRAGAMLAAARVRDDALLVFGHRGASGFGVVHVHAGDETTVRHPTRGACEDLDLSSAGGRAAVVLELDGAVQMALVGSEGKVIERPHEVLPRVKLRAPQIVWTENTFTVLAREGDRLRIQSLDESEESFVLPRCQQLFSAAFFAQHLFALELEPSESGAELRLWRVARDGSQPQQRLIMLSLRDAGPRRARLATRRVLSALVDRFDHAHGYRTLGTRPALSADGASVSMLDREGRLSVGIDSNDGAISMRVVSALGDDPRLPDPPSSLVRLAQWVHARFSADSRAREDNERAWAESLAASVDASLSGVERAGAVLVLELELPALPAVERLEEWLRRLRREQLDRLKEIPEGPKA